MVGERDVSRIRSQPTVRWDSRLAGISRSGPQQSEAASEELLGPRRTAWARLRVLEQAQTAEVHLRHLSRRGVLHWDRAAAPAPPVAASDEPVQGRVGHLTPSGCQQLLNSGELQALDVEPPVDLVSVDRITSNSALVTVDLRTAKSLFGFGSDNNRYSVSIDINRGGHTIFAHPDASTAQFMLRGRDPGTEYSVEVKAEDTISLGTAWLEEVGAFAGLDTCRSCASPTRDIGDAVSTSSTTTSSRTWATPGSWTCGPANHTWPRPGP